MPPYLNRFTAAIVLFACGLFVELHYASAEENSRNNDRRDRCIQILREAMRQKGNLPLTVRAAEALLWNVYPDGVDGYFKSLEADPGDSLTGSLYIGAKANKENAILFQEYRSRLREQFLYGDSSAKFSSLGYLCRLRFHERLPEIQRLARERSGPIGVLACWSMANSGREEDLAGLTRLLGSSEPLEYSLAAFAMRHLESLSAGAIRSLQSCHRRLIGEDRPNVFISSALFIHAPRDAEGSLRKELHLFLKGEPDERREACEALAERGNLPDIPRLEQLLEDEDGAVRVAAANALLRIERRQQKGMLPADWCVIVFYVISMLGIGFYYQSRQKTSEEYLVGNRRVNSIASGISLFASFLSTITYLAVAGETIKHGPLVVLVYICCLPLVYFLAAHFVIPYFMTVRITSAYEIIERPFGKGVRMTGSVIFLMTRFVWMGLLTFLTAKTLVVMLGWNEEYILYISILCGIITVIYSTMGGLRAVIVTDVTQFIILIFGAILTLILVTAKLGGIAVWMPTEWAPNWDRVVLFSLDPYLRLTVVFLVLNRVSYWVCTAGSDQMAIQRFIATKDVRSARRSFLTAQSVETGLFLILMCVGFAILNFYRSNPHLIPDGKDLIADADFLFPNFIANGLPVGISGLLIVALFSAAMSSLSAGINSTASVVIADILPWLTKRNRNADENLARAKGSSMIIGVLVVGISSGMQNVPGNIMEVTAKTSNFFVSPLFNLFFMAFFVPFATPFGTIMGSVYGIAAAYILSYWDVMTGSPPITFLWIVPGSLLVSIAAGMLFSLMPTRGKTLPVRVMWSAMVLVPIALVLIYIYSI